ncbi:uncharacterized protein LOC113311905 [Papaver somniferum]|uniref:uncharacterized protein LOC113311905 n=1 Tax=Papaver somniferum TaxID=3469 RepID=UPI000E6FCDAF|nr:uncharacterized protein LOC113311905 [Papaver somniferum]
MEQSSASGIPKNPDKFINVVLNHGEYSAVFRVNTKITVEELNHLACKQWRSLSPGSICFSYMDNAQVVFVTAEVSGSKSGCSSSSGSCSKSACETESPKMVRVLDHDADKGKPLIIDEWNYGDPSLKPIQIISLFKKTYGSNIKYHHARRGKEAVFEEQYDDDEKSYSDFTWYVKAIEETNPDSYMRFEVEDETNRFQRIFVCYGACKHSYRYLRPMIYLDATFPTGRYRGTLMAATCINGNNEFYPFAFAIVSSENKDNWFWFLENLQKLVDGRPIVFLSDRGEGLLQGIPKYFPNSHHSYCFYHIKCNLPIGSGDANSKPVLDLFYKVSYSYTPANFEEALRGTHAIGCGHVANYIRTIPKEKWANVFFPVCRYGAHSSTLAESFNNWVLPFKKLPAFVLLDAIRLMVMEKMSEKRILGLEIFNTRLTPEYEALLKENIDIGRTWTVVHSMERLYEVRWRVNGFPCAHACAAIQATREDIYSFVEPYFTTEWYNMTYQHIIFPIPNYDKPKSYDPSDRVIVPIPVPPPGRRRTHRIKNAYENQKRAMMCTKCFTLRHHNRTTFSMI